MCFNLKSKKTTANRYYQCSIKIESAERPRRNRVDVRPMNTNTVVPTLYTICMDIGQYLTLCLIISKLTLDNILNNNSVYKNSLRIYNIVVWACISTIVTDVDGHGIIWNLISRR